MEKLWTTTEVARFLGVPEDDVTRLVREGRLTGYKLAGEFLRFKPEQVQALKGRMAPLARPAAGPASCGTSSVGSPSAADTPSPEKIGPARSAARSAARGTSSPARMVPARSPARWIERLRNFVYFYDFYLLSFLLLTAVVLYLISAT